MTAEESPSRVPVVIVGAGPVGVTAAILLARRGVRCVILERHRDVYPLPRAVAIDDETFRILQAVGIHEDFEAIARPARGLRLLDARHRVMATFRRDDPQGHHGFPETSLYDQPELERLLRRALAECGHCDIRGGVEVTEVWQQPDNPDAPARVTYHPVDGGEPESLWADAVLGCDGANSIVREAIGAAWEDLRFQERWMVLDARTALPVRTWEGVDQVCDPARAATFMRVGEHRYRWEFRLHDGEDLALAGPAGIENVRELIRPWVVVADDGDFEVIRHTEYVFRARLADHWRLGRVFLLGDAAHQTPPFIGQGLCAGLRDAYNLSWKLARVLAGGADKRLLDSYESERRPHARHLIRLAVAMGWAMTGGQDRAAVVRRSALAALCRIPGLTTAVAAGISPVLVPGPLVRRNRLAGGRRLVGSVCPQPWVTTGGQRMRLDDVLGDSFTVLTAAPLAPAVRAVADAVGARIVHLEAACAGPQEIVVSDGDALAAWLRGGRAEAVLLRPDRVVLDTVPAGGAVFSNTAAWAPLLYTGAGTGPARRSQSYVDADHETTVFSHR